MMEEEKEVLRARLKANLAGSGSSVEEKSVAAEVANMRQGSRTDLEPSANLPEVSTSSAADLLNVSRRTLQSAR